MILMNGENRIQDRKRGDGGNAILDELKIVDFPKTLDRIPKQTHTKKITRTIFTKKWFSFCVSEKKEEKVIDRMLWASVMQIYTDQCRSMLIKQPLIQQ